MRGVVDGFATHAEIRELAAIEPVVPAGQVSSISTWRWDVPDDPPIFRTLIKRAQAVLQERFGISNLRFYRSNIITWKGPHQPTNEAPATWTPRSLHGDTNTDEMFLFTTILYLSQHGEDCLGGETGIADVISVEVKAGLRVQPAIGRLLVFSSGVENMHEMLRLLQGKRVAMQMWFACDGQNPGWARSQRIAWQEKYGYGGPVSNDAHSFTAPPLSDELAHSKAWPSL